MALHTHVVAMGEHLTAHFGGEYFTIGTEYYRNTLIARKDIGYDPAAASAVNDFSDLIRAFINSDMEIGVLDVHRHIESGGEIGRLLTLHQRMGSIGAIFDPALPPMRFTENIVPASSYDVIIFVRNATPAAFIE